MRGVLSIRISHWLAIFRELQYVVCLFFWLHTKTYSVCSMASHRQFTMLTELLIRGMENMHMHGTLEKSSDAMRIGVIKSKIMHQIARMRWSTMGGLQQDRYWGIIARRSFNKTLWKAPGYLATWDGGAASEFRGYLFFLCIFRGGENL